jgi:hypothetical protein
MGSKTACQEPPYDKSKIIRTCLRLERHWIQRHRATKKMALTFEWDANKAKRNLAKHGIGFEESPLFSESSVR